jgi:predicted transcriptional regulator
LSRFSYDVIKRIRDTLTDNGKMKISNLALKANVQYTRLVRYLRWLQAIGAVEIISDGRFKYVLMTRKGNEVFSLFLGFESLD